MATWTPERAETCERLWAEGFSASQIARRLGDTTRNAVIGKLFRMGKSSHAPPKKPQARGCFKPKWTHRHDTVLSELYHAGVAIREIAIRLQVSKATVQYQRDRLGLEKRRDAQPKISDAPLPPEPPTPETLVKFVDLDTGMCRFPFGDPKSPEFGFCGCKTAPGSSYCEGHMAVCSTSPRVGMPRAPVEYRYQHKLKTHQGRKGRNERVVV